MFWQTIGFSMLIESLSFCTHRQFAKNYKLFRILSWIRQYLPLAVICKHPVIQNHTSIQYITCYVYLAIAMESYPGAQSEMIALIDHASPTCRPRLWQHTPLQINVVCTLFCAIEHILFILLLNKTTTNICNLYLKLPLIRYSLNKSSR